MRHWVWLGTIWLGLLPATAWGQFSDAERSVARDLGNEGIDLYEKGRYPDALQRLERAYAVLKAPTLALWLARALEKNGKLVEAAERYREVIRTPLASDAPRVFIEAQASAKAEQAKLGPRIPTVTVVLEGAKANEVGVSIDGTPVKSALVGLPFPLNPGTHAIEGNRAGTTAAESVTFAEGEKKSVALRFGGASTGAMPPRGGETTPPPVGGDPAGPAGPVADQGAEDGSLQRTLGWVGLGVGGAGLVFGGVTGLMVLSKKSALDDGDCLDGACGPSERSQVESYNSMRTLSTVGFVVGGVGLAAGATLLLTAPRDESAAAYVSPWVGLASAGVAGRF